MHRRTRDVRMHACNGFRIVLTCMDRSHTATCREAVVSRRNTRDCANFARADQRRHRFDASSDGDFFDIRFTTSRRADSRCAHAACCWKPTRVSSRHRSIVARTMHHERPMQSYTRGGCDRLADIAERSSTWRMTGLQARAAPRAHVRGMCRRLASAETPRVYARCRAASTRPCLPTACRPCAGASTPTCSRPMGRGQTHTAARRSPTVLARIKNRRDLHPGGGGSSR